MYKYPIIVFEGIETSGKSTNLLKVSNFLKKIKRNFIKIREPGGSMHSEIIRKIILNKYKLNFKTDLLLLMASRSENYEKILKKNNGKKIILIDRFIDSTKAYQHYGMGLNLNLINRLNSFILGRFKPSFTILSIVNKKNLKLRLSKRIKINRYDKFNFSFYNKVQKGYIELAKNKRKYLIIDSNKQSINENSDIIINKVKKLI